MDVVVLAGDRKIPSSDEFPQNLAPFPEPSDLIYAQPTAAIQAPDSIDRRPVSPPQKLRPIRCSARCPAGEFPEDAGIAGTLAGELPVGEAPRSDSVWESDAARVGSGPFVEGWEANDVNEDESRRVHEFFSALSSSSDDSVDHSSVKFDGPETEGKRKRKSRRNLKHFMENMAMRVMEKQEQMHSQLIEAIEKMDKERMSREEAWRRLEMERHRRDELERAQETSRSLALISFLRNFLDEEIQLPTPEPISQHRPEKNWLEIDAGAGTKCDPGNKRWPENEVQALITIRTSLDHKFRGSGCKGSIWEEVSVGMSAMGYTRTGKNCKQKWENMNKYFRKSTENGKKRTASGKTCPYFNDLDSLYKTRVINPGVAVSVTSSGDETKSERDSESL